MTYLSHFGLDKPPFAVTPDPNFAYATSEHEQALLKIAYYTEEKQGLFLLIGEIGTGKTTISKLASNGWRTQPNKYTVGQISDPSRKHRRLSYDLCLHLSCNRSCVIYRI